MHGKLVHGMTIYLISLELDSFQLAQVFGSSCCACMAIPGWEMLVAQRSCCVSIWGLEVWAVVFARIDFYLDCM